MNRALHSSTNYILANMIAADTLTVLFCPAVFICTDFFQNYLLGFLGCKLDGFIQGAFHIPYTCFRPNFVFVVSVVSFDGWLLWQVQNVRQKVNDLYFTVTFLLTAVFNMCVVSYDRLTAIVLPMEKRITMRSAKMTMFLTWMVGLTISIPFAIYRNYKVSRCRNPFCRNSDE